MQDMHEPPPRRRRPTAAIGLGAVLAGLVAGLFAGLFAVPGRPSAGDGDAGTRSLIGTRCREEIAKLCEDVKPGGGRLARCLRSHEAELSSDCKAALAASWGGRAPTKK